MADGGYRLVWQGAQVARSVEDAVQDALEETGRAAVATARSLAPVRTGRLQASIEATVSISGGRRTLTLSADVPYAGYVERGTGRMRARPFIAPAMQQQIPQLSARITAAIQRRGI